MKGAPLILITPSTQRNGVEFADASLSLSNRYAQAVVVAGGVPWVLPCSRSPELIAESVRRCDGVMLTGGDDVEPKLYTKKLSPRLQKTVSPIDPTRDLFEMLLIAEIFRQRKPLLAICRGQQILNVALGGTLYVDIPSQVPQALDHSRTDRKDQLVHDANLTEGSLLAKVFRKRKIGVNSSHHQAVARVAKPLRVTAASPDGIIEGMELASSESSVLPYLLAVQFHPERLIANHPEFVEMFRSFTRASQSARRRSQ